jgi:hypothetical protein
MVGPAPSIAVAARVVVVLDTSVVRGFAAGDAACSSFRSLQPATALARFCLCDTSVGELGLWLARAGEQEWSQWKSVQRDVASVLDAEAPLVHAHHPKGSPPSREHERAIASLLCTAQSRADLQAGFPIDDDHRAVLQIDEAHQRLENDLEKWCTYVIEAANVAAAESDFTVILASFEAALAQVFGSQASRRLEPYARGVARFIELRRRGYNPRGGRREGDHLDLRLVSTLMSTDFVCTNDARLLDHLRQARCRDMDRILPLADLVEMIEKGRLSPFVSDG